MSDGFDLSAYPSFEVRPPKNAVTYHSKSSTAPPLDTLRNRPSTSQLSTGMFDDFDLSSYPSFEVGPPKNVPKYPFTNSGSAVAPPLVARDRPSMSLDSGCSSSSISPPLSTDNAKIIPVLDPSIFEPNVIYTDAKRKAMFKLERKELLEFVREELYCTLGSSPTGMALPVLINHFSDDANEDLHQIAKTLGFCSINEMLHSPEFSDIIEPTTADHVLGAANTPNAFCYKVIEIPQTRHIIRVLKDRVTANETKERAKRAALFNPAYEGAVLEGKLRLLKLAAELGAETRGVYFGDIQAAYLREHSVPLDKKELKRFFQCSRIKEVVSNLLFEDVRLYEDTKRTGSLYIELKRPLKDIMDSANKILAEKEALKLTQLSATQQKNENRTKDEPEKQQPPQQLQKEEKQKQKKYEPELVPLAYPSHHLFTDDVKVREKYTAVQKFAEDFDAALARSGLSLESNGSDSALDICAERSQQTRTGTIFDNYSPVNSPSPPSDGLTKKSVNDVKLRGSSERLPATLSDAVSTIKPSHSYEMPKPKGSKLLKFEENYSTSFSAAINDQNLFKDSEFIGTITHNSRHENDDSNSVDMEKWNNMFSEYLNHYASAVQKSSEKPAPQKASGQNRVSQPHRKVTVDARPSGMKHISRKPRLDSSHTNAKRPLRSQKSRCTSSSANNTLPKKLSSTEKNIAPHPMSTAATVSQPEVRNGGPKVVLMKEWSGSRNGGQSADKSAPKKSLSEVLNKIESLNFDTASTISSSSRPPRRRIHVPMKKTTHNIRMGKHSVVALPNSSSMKSSNKELEMQHSKISTTKAQNKVETASVKSTNSSASNYSTAHIPKLSDIVINVETLFGRKDVVTILPATILPTTSDRTTTANKTTTATTKTEVTNLSLTPSEVEKFRSSILLVMSRRNATALKVVEVNHDLEALLGKRTPGVAFLVNFVRQHVKSIDVKTVPTSEIIFVQKVAQRMAASPNP